MVNKVICDALHKVERSKFGKVGCVVRTFYVLPIINDGVWNASRYV